MKYFRKINFNNSSPLPEADPPLADNPPDEIGKKGNLKSSLSLKRGTEGELEYTILHNSLQK